MKASLTAMMAVSLLLLTESLYAAGVPTPPNAGNSRREAATETASPNAPAGTDRHPDTASGNFENARLGDLVTLKGKLKCDLGSSNTGEACSLLFLDAGSGRTFQLTSQEKAMRMYFDSSNATHEITLQGKIMGVETLEVVDVSQR